MSTSRAVTPRWRMRARALSRVRLLVPKPGIVKRLDARARHAEGVDRLAGHQQGQRRIEAAGDADAGRGLADVFQALGQAGHLRLENLLAALAQLIAFLRHEGMGVDHPAQVGRRRPWRQDERRCARNRGRARRRAGRRRSCWCGCGPRGGGRGRRRRSAARRRAGSGATRPGACRSRRSGSGRRRRRRWSIPRRRRRRRRRRPCSGRTG